MQVVILAAGRGTRMVELTEGLPKPMLEVNGKSLMEYKLEALPDDVNEVIIVVGYLKDVIQRKIGSRFADKRILYVEQKELNGTAGALWSTQSVLKDRFVVMMGDDIYAREDVERCMMAREWALVVQQMPEMHRAGDVQLDENANIVRIVEGDKNTEPGLASTNLFLLDTRLFSCPLVPKQEGSLEYGLPQTVIAASQSLGIHLEPIFTDKWIQITAPKDLVGLAEILKKSRA